MHSIDRNGIEIKIGQTLRVVYCIGAHGKMATVEGVVLDLDRVQGARLKLTAKPMTTTYSEYHARLAVGEDFYVSLPGRIGAGNWLCSLEHTDVDHAHHAFAEVTAAA